MDRQIVYQGAIPRAVDQLQQSKNTMVGLGYLMQAILGVSTLVDGLACAATSPASLSVNVATGSIYSLQNVDATAYGILPADTTDQIVKQGVIIGTTTFNCPAPATVGQSVVYLVEVAYQDLDSGTVTLPYYNASNSAQAFNGPNNTGVSQNTVRQGLCLLQLKTGVAATTGTQQIPAADAGFTGLYAITVANGQTTITSGNIQTLATAPFINPKLPAVVGLVQSGAPNYGVDTSGTVNTITVALTPAITSLVAGQWVSVKMANTNTAAPVMNVNGTGNVACYGPDGNALHAKQLKQNVIYDFVYDGAHWVLQSMSADVQYGSASYAADTGAVNAYVASVPEVETLTAGTRVAVLIANTNTGASTFNFNSLGVVAIKKISNTSLANMSAGDLPAGFIVDLEYDGTQWQALNVRTLSGYLQAANNLSDLTNTATARTNLGVGYGSNMGSDGSGNIIGLMPTNFQSGSTYTVQISDNGKIINNISATGTLTITLNSPTSYGAPFSNGMIVGFQRQGAQSIVINSVSAGININGSGFTSVTLSNPNSSLILYGQGGGWWLLYASPDIACKQPTITALTSGSGTYTTPTGCVRLKIRMVGAGGGSGGSSGGYAGTGGYTFFGSWSAYGGNGGGGSGTWQGGTGGSGGTNSTGTLIKRQSGVQGASGNGVEYPSCGGSTPFGGAGPGPVAAGAAAGIAAAANTGSGAGAAIVSSGSSPGAGGSGEYVEFMITSPAASYSYAVGASGSAGAGSPAGGLGGSGVILIEEFYY